jgi:hypothetical protein
LRRRDRALDEAVDHPQRGGLADAELPAELDDVVSRDLAKAPRLAEMPGTELSCGYPPHL